MSLRDSLKMSHTLEDGGGSGQGDDLPRPVGLRSPWLGAKPLVKKGHHLSVRILSF